MPAASASDSLLTEPRTPRAAKKARLWVGAADYGEGGQLAALGMRPVGPFAAAAAAEKAQLSAAAAGPGEGGQLGGGQLAAGPGMGWGGPFAAAAAAEEATLPAAAADLGESGQLIAEQLAATVRPMIVFASYQNYAPQPHPLILPCPDPPSCLCLCTWWRQVLLASCDMFWGRLDCASGKSGRPDVSGLPAAVPLQPAAALAKVMPGLDTSMSALAEKFKQFRTASKFEDVS